MKKLLYLAAALVTLSACKDKKTDPVDPPRDPETAGFFISNEGDWHQNNATIFYYDQATKTSYSDYYANANAGQKLGDLANDILVYGFKVYITLEDPNHVVVLSAKDGSRLASIDMGKLDDNSTKIPRRLAAANGKVYASLNNGEAVQIDTATLAVTNRAALSESFSEGICVSKDGATLYVANSGVRGDFFGGAGTTVSMVSLTGEFKETGTIATPANPNRLATADNGDIYLTTWTSWIDGITKDEARLHRIDPKTNKVTYTFSDINVSKFALCGNYAYTIDESYLGGGVFVKKVNLTNNTATDFLGATPPVYYSVGANTMTNEIFYLSTDGNVVCYDTDGKEQYKLTNVGLRPGAISFWIY